MMGLSYDWTSMNSLVDLMQPAGNTNQPIGLVWGWQSLVGGGPLAAPAKDSNYTYKEIIILLSDGLNTQNRWSGSQSSVDGRMYNGSGNGTYPNFADSYKHNIAAYLLDKLLNIGMIPATVGRKVQGENASVTWWVDDVLMTEKQRYLRKVSPPDGKAWNRQIYCVRTFDELIYNFDRNLGNLVITKTWRLWMIDHTRSFLPYPKPKNEKRLIECDRHLLEAMRGLTREAAKALEPHLGVLRVDGLLSRRDRIVEYFEKEIARRGEEKVLFTILPFDTVVNLPESGGV
jgi:hypothetical protein